MSHQGYLSWYTESQTLDPVHVLKHLPKLLGFQRAQYVFRERTNEECNADDSEDDLDIGNNILASELHRLYVAPTTFRVHTQDCILAKRIGEIVAAIPEDVRNDWIPHNLLFVVGEHELQDLTTEEIIAHPTVCVEAWGYNQPKNWAEMRRCMAHSKDIHGERLKVEHLLGPLKQAVYWTV